MYKKIIRNVLIYPLHALHQICSDKIRSFVRSVSCCSFRVLNGAIKLQNYSLPHIFPLAGISTEFHAGIFNNKLFFTHKCFDYHSYLCCNTGLGYITKNSFSALLHYTAFGKILAGVKLCERLRIYVCVEFE